MINIEYNILFFVCIAFAMLINMLLVNRCFYNHIDFTKERYHHIDGIKGIAALCVLMNHAVFSFQNNGFTINNIKADFWIFYHAGNLGVQIFFCITGFLFFDKIIKSKNNIQWDDYFISRINRLVPLYIITTTIVLMLTLYLAPGTNKSYIDTIRQSFTLYGFGFMGADIYVDGFKTSSLNAVIWTLPYEWKFYCIIPFICALLKNKILTTISVVLLFGYAASDLINGSVVWIYFISGALAAYIKNYNTIEKITRFLQNQKILSSVAVTLFLFYVINSRLPPYGVDRFYLVSLAFIFIVIAKPKILEFKSLVYLGEASYSSYLLHLIINALIIRGIGKFYNLNNINSIEFYIIICVLIIVTTYVTAYSFKYIELYFIKNKKNIFYNPKKQQKKEQPNLCSKLGLTLKCGKSKNRSVGHPIVSKS